MLFAKHRVRSHGFIFSKSNCMHLIKRILTVLIIINPVVSSITTKKRKSISIGCLTCKKSTIAITQSVCNDPRSEVNIIKSNLTVLEHYNLLKKNIKQFFDLEKHVHINCRITKNNDKEMVFYFNNHEILIPTDEYNVYMNSEGLEIKLIHPNTALLIDSGIIIRMIYDMFRNIYFSRTIRDTEADFINTLEYLNYNMNNSEEKLFWECFSDLMKGYKCNLFDFYKIIFIRRDFLQVMYPGIIPLENYLSTIEINEEMIRKYNSNSCINNKVVFLKILGSFRFITLITQAVYNTVKDRDIAKLFNLDPKTTPENENQQYLLDAIHTMENLIEYLLEQITFLNNGDKRIYDQYVRYIKNRDHFTYGIKNYICSIIFIESSDVTAEIMTQLISFGKKEKEDYKINRKLFYNRFLDYIKEVFDYKLNCDESFWNEICVMLDKFYQPEFCDKAGYLDENDGDAFNEIFSKLHYSKISDFIYDEKIIICKTNLKTIEKRHRRYIGVKRGRNTMFKIF